MKLVKFIFLIVCGVFLLSCSKQGSVLHDTQGKEIKTADLQNKWVIINYWASWCDNCLKEIPELNLFNKNKNSDNIVLLGVNYDRLPMAELQQAITKMHIDFPVLLENPTAAWDLGDIDVLPVTFIIDSKGRVVKRILGGVTQKMLANTLNELQKEFI